MKVYVGHPQCAECFYVMQVIADLRIAYCPNRECINYAKLVNVPLVETDEYVLVDIKQL